MKLKSLVLGLVAAFGIGSVASAATITFNLGATSSSGWKNSLTYSSGGLDLTVTGAGYSNTGSISGNKWVATWAGHGLGVADRYDSSHQVDGSGGNDVAIFSFSKAVTLVSVAFNYVDRFDYFDLFSSQTGTPSLVSANNGVKSLVNFANPISGSVFGIGASQSWSAFKIWSITVNVPDAPAPVPVPAAGLMLLGGLGAVAALRRKRRSA